MNVLQYLASLRPTLPYTTTVPSVPMTNGELRRLCNNKAVLINGETVAWDELMDFSVFSLVFFPKGNRKTTLV